MAKKALKPVKLTDEQARAELLKLGAKNPDRLYIRAPRGMDTPTGMAVDAVAGITDNAVAMHHWVKRGHRGANEELPITHCVEALKDEIRKVQTGDLSQVDAMLFGQATALAGVFHACLARASANIGEHLGATETYMRLALKAQSQCRTTLETLVEAKNPRSVAFVRQANIANGHQQVNNGDARATESPQNELQGDFNVVDARAEAARVGVDAPAAAVAQSNRPAHARRKVAIKPKRMEGRNKARTA